MADKSQMPSVSIHHILTLLALIGTAPFITSCSQTGKANASAAQGEQAAISVAVMRVTRQELSRYQSMMAEFRPYQEVDVNDKVDGNLKKILVDVGESVEQGELTLIVELQSVVSCVSYDT